jgi:tetratricopeptide (TPR) repeat protein
MFRWIPALLVASAALLSAQSSAQQPPPEKGKGELQRERQKPAAAGKEGAKEEAPPEEDKALATEEYSFNPLQAQKEVQTGNYYYKKGSYRAAAGRFREATRWNDGYGEAWLRLGEAEEKLKDAKAAKEAYARYLELASDDKNADEIRKRLKKLK